VTLAGWVAPERRNTAGLVLAGGRSQRMGRDKALLPLHGRTLIEHALDRLRPQVATLLVSRNDPDREVLQIAEGFGAPCIGDTLPGFAGPLAGMLAALEWLDASAVDAHWLMTVPCDTPGLPPDLGLRLAQAAAATGARLAMVALESADPDVPPSDQPTFMLLHRSLRPVLAARLAAGERRVGAWARGQGAAPARFAVGEAAAFANVNTPADLARLERLADAPAP
jgi:molybdenum cofactor guanylyltransferase